MKDMLLFYTGLSCTAIHFYTMATESCFTHREGSQICNQCFAQSLNDNRFPCQEKFTIFLRRNDGKQK